MRDFELNLNELFAFSQKAPYTKHPFLELKNQVNQLKEELNFPMIHDDVGSFMSFLFKLKKPAHFFEFGSGFGGSAYWALHSAHDFQRITLTERRDDLLRPFNDLPWPKSFKEKTHYIEGCAFDAIETSSDLIDFALIDGQKSDYLLFLEKLYPKLSVGAVVLIDNSFWRGSFLNDEMLSSKKSAQKIRDLHLALFESEKWQACFVPFIDGVSLIFKH